MVRFVMRHYVKALRHKPVATLLVSAFILVACGSNRVSDGVRNTAESLNPFGGGYSPYGGTSKPSSVKIGKPYTIKGKRYQPRYQPDYDETGQASWYGPGFHGRQTANGERYDQYAMTAAHKTLPLPSVVRVTRTDTGKSIIVRVNDRGPFAHGRIIDLSKKGAKELGMIGSGVAPVRVQYLPQETEDYIVRNGLKMPSYMQEARRSRAVRQVASAPEPAYQPPARSRAERPHSLHVDNDGFGLSISLNDVIRTKPTPPASIPARYKVQTASFVSRINAERHAKNLHNIGQANITQVGSGSDAMYRVTLGPVDAYEQAVMLTDKTKAMGFDDARIVVD